MTITIKTGVPGSGKTQSMVSELLDMTRKMMRNGGKFRPIYTNIDGLDQAVIPHHKLANMPPLSEVFSRAPGVLYTVDWMQCPPESLVVIDEAQDHGFDAMATQAKVPDHVRLLAQHRKDYSVDIWFISQHPKQLHSRLRVLCARHQHYERKFGMRSAFCFEWPSCHDNFDGKKTAVVSRFAFHASAQSAYASSQVHTKVKYKLPLWIWLPVLLIPFAIYVLPQTVRVFAGIMGGKGVSIAEPVKPPTSAVVPVGAVGPVGISTATSAGPLPAVSAALSMSAAVVPDAVKTRQPNGCIVLGARCSCLYDGALRVELDSEMCEDMRIRGPAIYLGADEVTMSQRQVIAQGDIPVLTYMHLRRP